MSMWPSKININQKDGVLSENATQDEIQEERPSSSADAGVAASDSDWSDDEDGQQPGESFQEWEARINFPPGVTRPCLTLSGYVVELKALSDLITTGISSITSGRCSSSSNQQQQQQQQWQSSVGSECGCRM